MKEKKQENKYATQEQKDTADNRIKDRITWDNYLNADQEEVTVIFCLNNGKQWKK